ncbi:hypothetical protein J2S74_002171 [Evansella vedderi]|uniref:Uncharacterized protein n=1 Tax=Evansella vedderi TaxID=38282 RepID=A0ABT9ZU68_9BACI|nr:hypothetical protein [Evansella vedderi]
MSKSEGTRLADKMIQDMKDRNDKAREQANKALEK